MTPTRTHQNGTIEKDMQHWVYSIPLSNFDCGRADECPYFRLGFRSHVLRCARLALKMLQMDSLLPSCVLH